MRCHIHSLQGITRENGNQSALYPACLKVVGESSKEGLIAWAPYETEVTEMLSGKDTLTAELVLTRRNTFGPLHAVPLRAGGCDPGNWVTSGDSFTDEYMLYPAGLLEAPVLAWRTVK